MNEKIFFHSQIHADSAHRLSKMTGHASLPIPTKGKQVDASAPGPSQQPNSPVQESRLQDKRGNEDSDTEEEVIRPRKPRRKLSTVVNPAPPKANEQAIKEAFNKIMICETAEFVQDFEDAKF